MRYLLAIYSNEKADEAMRAADAQKIYMDYGAFTESAKAKGVYMGGEPLRSTADATTVRVRDGKTATTDGPFAETKEQLGGYYLLDCANLDEAIEWAAKIPHAALGSIEIRPIMVFGNSAEA